MNQPSIADIKRMLSLGDSSDDQIEKLGLAVKMADNFDDVFEILKETLGFDDINVIRLYNSMTPETKPLDRRFLIELKDLKHGGCVLDAMAFCFEHFTPEQFSEAMSDLFEYRDNSLNNILEAVKTIAYLQAGTHQPVQEVVETKQGTKPVTKLEKAEKEALELPAIKKSEDVNYVEVFTPVAVKDYGQAVRVTTGDGTFIRFITREPNHFNQDTSFTELNGWGQSLRGLYAPVIRRYRLNPDVQIEIDKSSTPRKVRFLVPIAKELTQRADINN